MFFFASPLLVDIVFFIWLHPHKWGCNHINKDFSDSQVAQALGGSFGL